MNDIETMVDIWKDNEYAGRWVWLGHRFGERLNDIGDKRRTVPEIALFALASKLLALPKPKRKTPLPVLFMKLNENELVQLMGSFTPAAVAYAKRVPALAVLAHRLAVLEVSDEDIAVALAWLEQRALLRAALPTPSAPVTRDEGVACQPRATMTKDVAVERAICMLHAGSSRDETRLREERNEE